MSCLYLLTCCFFITIVDTNVPAGGLQDELANA